MVNEGSTLDYSFRDTLRHFITYIEKDNMMWELDGRLEGPCFICNLTQGKTLEDEASKLIKTYKNSSNEI